MSVTLGQWGGSAAVRLPKDILRKGNFVFGDEFDVELKDGEVVLKPAAKRIAPILPAEVLKGWKGGKHSNPFPEWQNHRPLGNEYW